MTRFQFHNVMLVLWLLASQGQAGRWSALGCAMMLTVHLISALFARDEHVKGVKP